MMKIKIIGFFVCMLLILTTLSATGATNVRTLKDMWEKNDLEKYSSTLADSPGIITVKIVAKVENVYDPYNLLDGAIQVGDKFTGQYIYDSEKADSDPDPNIGLYEYTSSSCGIELKNGEFVFKTDPNDVDFYIWILNDNYYYYYGDLYVVSSKNNLPLSNGIQIFNIVWDLFDPTGNAFSDDALPTTAPVLPDWLGNSLDIQGRDPSYPNNIFIITFIVTKATLNRNTPKDVCDTLQPILIWLFERFPMLQRLLNIIF